MDKKKRERNVNFTWAETEKLVSLVESKKHIIESKKSDAVTWREKEHAWKAIATEFNSCGSEAFRDSKQLKFKYEALKRDTRKKASSVREERYKTGGGLITAPLLTPIEQKIKEMILPPVEGGRSSFDSDPLDVAVKDENVADPDSLFILEEQDNLEQVDAGALDNKPNLKRPFDKLADAKMEIVHLQKKIIEEEMVEKGLKTELLRLEMKHKKELYELEKSQMLLKIEILKAELENLQKK